jgi:hypothetical protein
LRAVYSGGLPRRASDQAGGFGRAPPAVGAVPVRPSSPAKEAGEPA